jgi:hypothetical protein
VAEERAVRIRRLASRVRLWWIIGVLELITVFPLVLGYIGLAQYLPHQAPAGYGDSWDDILYYDLQLFTLSSAPAGDPGPFPVALEFARFLAPAVTLLAAFTTLFVLVQQVGRFPPLPPELTR